MPGKAASGKAKQGVLVPRDPGHGRVTVAGSPLRVGRDPGCEAVVVEPTVSRRHARLLWDGDELVVEDLASSGGTFVNGIRVQRCAVQPGDVVRFGPAVEYVVEGEPPPGSGPLPLAAPPRQGQVRHLQVLLEATRALSSATVLDEVLDIVLRSIVEVTRAERGCVVLCAADGTRAAAAVYPRGSAEPQWGERSSLLDRALRDRRTAVAQAKIDPTTSMVLRGVGLAAATPLLVTRRPMGRAEDASFIASLEVIGGLLVEREAVGEPFSPDDLSVLESLAGDAAVAIDGARLYREAREKAKIEHEMELAHSIQKALLSDPPEVPFARIFTHAESARAVGGDLYHAVLRPDGTLAVALGDVSGKGLAAALLMAMVQGLLGLLNDLGHSVDEMLPVLDRALRRHNPGNKFLTLAMAVIAPDGSTRVTNAGHCPLIIVRKAGGVEAINSKGPILGILPNASWTAEELVLGPGDALVLYSDGVLESFSPEGCEFGLDGIRGALADVGGQSPAEIGQRLLAAAAAHRGGREPADDLTVLIVQLTGAS